MKQKRPLEKIRYRLVWNHSGRLNQRGEGLVQIVAQQGQQRRYFSTHVYVKPENWSRCAVTGLINADALNYALYEMLSQVERIELEYIRRGVRVTLPMLVEAYRCKLSPGATLREFGMAVVNQSDRKELTKQNYRTLLNDIDRFRHHVTVTDIDYGFVCAYDNWLRDRVGLNTRISRLRLLRALMYEAKRRDITDQNPFDRFRMQQPEAKRGYLSEKQVRQLEQMTLEGREDIVRDSFLLGCWTGLRFSDIVTLRQEHLQGGWIVKQMLKTGFSVEIPYTELFGGKVTMLVRKYGGDIGSLARQIGDNHTVNATLRRLLERVGADEKATFHTSRHTFATLLIRQGVEMTTIQRMLGHQKAETTRIYAEVDRQTIINDLFKNKKKKQNKRNNEKAEEHRDTDQAGVSQH